MKREEGCRYFLPDRCEARPCCPVPCQRRDDFADFFGLAPELPKVPDDKGPGQ